jgi:hypothetical protein
MPSIHSLPITTLLLGLRPPDKVPVRSSVHDRHDEKTSAAAPDGCIMLVSCSYRLCDSRQHHNNNTNNTKRSRPAVAGGRRYVRDQKVSRLARPWLIGTTIVVMDVSITHRHRNIVCSCSIQHQRHDHRVGRGTIQGVALFHYETSPGCGQNNHQIQESDARFHDREYVPVG